MQNGNAKSCSFTGTCLGNTEYSSKAFKMGSASPKFLNVIKNYQARSYVLTSDKSSRLVIIVIKWGKVMDLLHQYWPAL